MKNKKNKNKREKEKEEGKIDKRGGAGQKLTNEADNNRSMYSFLRGKRESK